MTASEILCEQLWLIAVVVTLTDQLVCIKIQERNASSILFGSYIFLQKKALEKKYLCCPKTVLVK